MLNLCLEISVCVCVCVNVIKHSGKGADLFQTDDMIS